MNKTGIEWVKNPDGSRPGWSWNPVTGCLNHKDGFCNGGGFKCYAYRLANGRLKPLYRQNRNTAPLPFPQGGEYGIWHLVEALADPFYPRFWPERLGDITNKLRRWGKNKIVHTHEPRGVFVCDMGDLFGIGIPQEWTGRVLEKMQYAKQDRFYLLTKQPQNLPQWSPFPDNCWVGVTATDSTMFAAAYFHLVRVEAKLKYLSMEPLLSWDNRATLPMIHQAKQAGVGWLIIGAQTKPYKPPKLEWVQSIVEAADRAKLPIFMKDNLKPLLGNNLRQEVPNG